MKLWAVFNGIGQLHVVSVRHTRKAAIEAFMCGHSVALWPDYRKKGYRCKRITVTVEGES